MSRRTSCHDKAYKAWIHTLPCLVCGCRVIEAHHAGRDKGMRQKPPDSTCIPLCVRHHRTGPEAWHDGLSGRDRWQAYHGIDVDGEIRRLNREYEAMGAKLAKPKHKRVEPKPVASAGKPKPMSERLRELRESKAGRKA